MIRREPARRLHDRVRSTPAHAAMARGSASFTLASRVFPASVRDDVAILYAWCRRTDDAVDEAPLGHERARVERLRAELDAVYSGAALTDPIAAAFQELVARRRVPRRHLDELLEGMAMDAARVRYADLADLHVYCYRVAGTVGIMMCHVMGLRPEVPAHSAWRHAADLGIAMQLTNICRDVAEDWERDRLYLPDSMLERAGARGLRERLGEPFPGHARGAVATVIQQLLARAEGYYRSGDAGLGALYPRCALAVRAARHIYAEIGQEIVRAGCDPLAGRAVVPAARKARLVLRASFETALAARSSP